LRYDGSVPWTCRPAGPTQSCRGECPRIRSRPIPTGLARRSSATVRSCTRTRLPRRHSARSAPLGGGRGWLLGTWLWALRGWLDRMVGGVGMRRARRHPTDLRRRRRRLLARRNARAWASAAASRRDAWARRCLARVVDHTRTRRRAVRSACRVSPRGLFGRVYWYSVAPFHRFIFGRPDPWNRAACREGVDGVRRARRVGLRPGATRGWSR
jgi:hypothetical protein